MTKREEKDEAPPPPRNCGNCLWYKQGQEKARGLCTINPPQAVAMPVESSQIAVAAKPNATSMATIPFFPPVAAVSRCRLHQFSDLGDGDAEPTPEEIIADAAQQQGESLANIAVSLDQVKTQLSNLIKLLQYTPQTGGTTGG